MSRIYFHSPSGTAEVSGSERAHAQLLTQRMTMAAIGPVYPHDNWIERFLDPATARFVREDITSRFEYEHRLDLWMHSIISDNAFILPDGKRLPVWDVVLNTAHRMGSDAVRLLTRLHAQCEIHCWVDGPHRDWLARVIEQGRHEGVLRVNMGWEDVVALLKARDDEPVVCSYSVTDTFPSMAYADWGPPVARDEDGTELPDEDPDYDAWYDLPSEEQWERAMAGLTLADEGLRYTREILPASIYHGSLTDYQYGAGISIFDLEAMVRVERV